MHSNHTLLSKLIRQKLHELKKNDQIMVSFRDDRGFKHSSDVTMIDVIFIY